MDSTRLLPMLLSALHALRIPIAVIEQVRETANNGYRNARSLLQMRRVLLRLALFSITGGSIQNYANCKQFQFKLVDGLTSELCMNDPHDPLRREPFRTPRAWPPPTATSCFEQLIGVFASWRPSPQLTRPPALHNVEAAPNLADRAF